MRKSVTQCCREFRYRTIDANEHITGRDFLLKIWRLIASTPLSVAIIDADMPDSTKANIFYELGVAQALGRETLVVKSPSASVPSDFVRSEYINFDRDFTRNFRKFLSGLKSQAEHYETVADQLDRNPILALDYLRRSYLITGNAKLRVRAKAILKGAGVDSRARNSIEMLAAQF